MNWIIKAIVEAFLNWLVKMGIRAAQEAKDRKETREEIVTEAKKNTEKVEKAETEQEKIDAIKDIASGSF